VHNNLFEIGSSLDESQSWSLEKEKSPQKSKEIKAYHEHSLVFQKEKRRGKPVSLVGEFFLEEKTFKELTKKFKKTLGTGGTCKDGWMEFQGDCQDKLRALIKQEGIRTKN
jgi:translation initiation factor 1